MIQIAPGKAVQVVGSVTNTTKGGVESRRIAGPWEPADLCIKRYSVAGEHVGLVSYILLYGDDDRPLQAVDAMLQADGWTLFEDATPAEQALYVKARMEARTRGQKTSLRAMLDSTPIAEIESYLEDRRRDEYLSKGCADGFERTPVEIDLGEVIIPEGAWIWTDEDGAIRRAFGRLDAPLGFEGGRKLRAVTIDEYEKVLQVWRVRPVRSAPNANLGSFDLNNDEHLALIRAEVLKAPITRRAV